MNLASVGQIEDSPLYFIGMGLTFALIVSCTLASPSKFAGHVCFVFLTHCTSSCTSSRTMRVKRNQLRRTSRTVRDGRAAQSVLLS